MLKELYVAVCTSSTLVYTSKPKYTHIESTGKGHYHSAHVLAAGVGVRYLIEALLGTELENDRCTKIVLSDDGPRVVGSWPRDIVDCEGVELG